LINEKEWAESDCKFKIFKESTEFAAFVRGKDASIFDVNDSFCEKLEIEEEILYDISLLNIIYT